MQLPAQKTDAKDWHYRLWVHDANGPASPPAEVSGTTATVGNDGPSPLGSITIPVVRPADFRKVTFVSRVDGSVQYFGYRPRAQPHDGGPGALMLHLHGAGDEAAGYRHLYYPKPWISMAHATNRRPFGFDWEDWGRRDAIEVLELATEMVQPDPRQIYLGGHSMGGHGVWQIAGHFPDQFASIGPGASWPDFWSYGGGAAEYDNPTPVQKILDRCVNPSRTRMLVQNYAHHGVFIIHGDADTVVDIGLAYEMRDLIRKFHDDVTMHVQPGGGHVYDFTPAEGKDAFDLVELFRFFQRHVRMVAPRQIKFVAVDPHINGRCYWAQIEQQQQPLLLSRLAIQLDPGRRVLFGTTENVRRMTLDLSSLIEAGALTLELDGYAPLQIAWDGRSMALLRTTHGWQLAGPMSPREKGPHRGGLFKNVFDHRSVLVVGTGGTDEENAWSLAKARFDSETFWYRGNGLLPVVFDRDFDPQADPDRSVVLYGNAETNGAWSALLGDSPVQVRRDTVAVGPRTFAGSDLGVLLIRPRPGSDWAYVGAVAGTGLTGMRATDRLPYFVSGIAYPDFIVFKADVWVQADAAVLAAGLFDNDWSLADGLMAFAEP